MFVDENGMTVADSDAPTFSQVDPNTSDAQILGGDSTRVIWGTNVSIQDTMSSFKNFLENYTSKYRMWADGATDEDTRAAGEAANRKEYLEMLRNMRVLGVTGLNLDVRNLKAYPSTLKLYHQLQSYPQEIIPLMDQTIKDTMIDEAEKELQASRTRRLAQAPVRNGMTSSEPAIPSSEQNDVANQSSNDPFASEKELITDVETKVYKVRPFGLEKPVNLRDLNPAGMLELAFPLKAI